jgi:hypothetical protein
MATQSEVDALRSAAARGVQEVRFSDGRTVRYASLTEMLQTAATLEQQISGGEFNRSTTTSFSRD